MPFRFTGEYIADMHFHHRASNGFDGICNGYGGVSVCRCVEDNAVRTVFLLQIIDYGAFHIALPIAKLHVGIAFTQFFQIILECPAAVNLRLSLAEQIEVGTVNYTYFFHCVRILCQ